jgi:serine/threonine protein kinase
VTELCTSDLYNLVATRKSLETSEIAPIARGLVHGLEYIHSRGLVHRDIKLQVRVCEL